LRLQERVRRLPGLAPAKLGQVVRLPDPVPASEPLLADPVALERQSALVAHPAVND
jgi:hypothetical protein